MTVGTVAKVLTDVKVVTVRKEATVMTMVKLATLVAHNCFQNCLGHGH